MCKIALIRCGNFAVKGRRVRRGRCSYAVWGLVVKVLRLGAEAECCRCKWQQVDLPGHWCCSSDVFCVLLEFVVRKSVTLEFPVQPVCHPNSSSAEPAGNGVTIHHYLFLFLIMATLCNRADHYIFALWFLLLLLSFFLA